MMKLCRSGLQNGADYGGLKAAKDSGLAITALMPKGWKTLDGPRPEYEKEFNAVEHFSSGYPGRTKENVRLADGTLRFAADFDSAGEKCTLGAILYYKKPYYDVNIDVFIALGFTRDIRDVYVKGGSDIINYVKLWIKQHNIQHLNIAGNSEKTCVGIGDCVYKFCMTLFKELKEDETK